MNANNLMLLCDALIFIFGIYAIYLSGNREENAVQSSILVAEEERKKIKDVHGFCSRLCRPTRIFGILSCIDACLDCSNWFVMHVPYIRYLFFVFYVLLYLWYMRELRKAKDRYMEEQ